MDLDPLTQPLPCDPPGTWAKREDRIAWIIQNLTRGEIAKLYELMHDGLGMRRDAARGIWEAERRILRSANGTAST